MRLDPTLEQIIFYCDPTSEHDVICLDLTLLPPRYPRVTITGKHLTRQFADTDIFYFLRGKHGLDRDLSGDGLELVTSFKATPDGQIYVYTVDGLPIEKGWVCDLYAEMVEATQPYDSSLKSIFAETFERERKERAAGIL